MKIFLWVVLLSSALFASFKGSTYNDRDEQVLETFGVSPSFLYDRNFLGAKNYVGGIRRDYFIKRYDEASDFIPFLNEMIIRAGIPQEFLYLAMIESGFSLRAYSPKKASGLWQFMPATAKLYGLQIDSFIDERRDPVRSTEAAVTHLKRLYAKFGKWYLAAIAYNCGEGRLQKAIEAAGSDELSVLLDGEKRYLPEESRDYIRKILSVSMMFYSIDTMKSSDYEHFLNRGAMTTIATVKIQAGTHLYMVAQSAGMSLEELKQYNRQFKHPFVPVSKKEYSVYLPYDHLSTFKQKYEPNSAKKANIFVVHKVTKGDTLTSIARKYGATIEEIKVMNGMQKSKLSINQQLVIPILKRAIASSQPPLNRTKPKASKKF